MSSTTAPNHIFSSSPLRGFSVLPHEYFQQMRSTKGLLLPHEYSLQKMMPTTKNTKIHKYIEDDVTDSERSSSSEEESSYYSQESQDDSEETSSSEQEEESSCPCMECHDELGLSSWEEILSDDECNNEEEEAEDDDVVDVIEDAYEGLRQVGEVQRLRRTMEEHIENCEKHLARMKTHLHKIKTVQTNFNGRLWETLGVKIGSAS